MRKSDTTKTNGLIELDTDRAQMEREHKRLLMDLEQIRREQGERQSKPKSERAGATPKGTTKKTK